MLFMELVDSWLYSQQPTSDLQSDTTAVAYRGWGGLNPPHPEIPKTFQNRAKLDPIVKTVKKTAKFRTPTPQDIRKKWQ